MHHVLSPSAISLNTHSLKINIIQLEPHSSTRTYRSLAHLTEANSKRPTCIQIYVRENSMKSLRCILKDKR